MAKKKDTIEEIVEMTNKQEEAAKQAIKENVGKKVVEAFEELSKKGKKEDEDYSKLAKKTGGQILADMPGVKYYLDTGNLAVNYGQSGKYINGGVPGGKIIELLGPSQGGKSYWASNIARGMQVMGGIPVYLDCEYALNPDFAAATSHINPKKLVRYGPADGIDCLEGVFLKIYNVIKAVREEYPTKPLLFIYDSISVSPSRRELKEIELTENYNDAEWKKKVGNKEQPGERAKICNKEFRKLEAILEKMNVTILVINQIRQKIGVLYGNPEVGSTASTVLEFYASCRMRVSAHKHIENTKLKIASGINLKIRNIKNRSFRPFLVAEDVQLFFDKGTNPLSGLLTSLTQAERIEAVVKEDGKEKKGTYRVKEPWAGGKDVTFKASKTRNDIDAEVLYQCPGLIDAKDEEEVRNYLAIFADAIAQGLSEETVEKELPSDLVEESE